MGGNRHEHKHRFVEDWVDLNDVGGWLSGVSTSFDGGCLSLEDVGGCNARCVRERWRDGCLNVERTSSGMVVDGGVRGEGKDDREGSWHACQAALYQRTSMAYLAT